MIMTQEHGILKAHAQFERMADFVRQTSSEGRRIDQIEADPWGQVLELGRLLRRLHGNSKRDQLSKVIGYLSNNRAHMRYDVCLSQGYPIGSGVVEGACRHVVKDRMEGTGMRWCIAGAQAMLGFAGDLRQCRLGGVSAVSHHNQDAPAVSFPPADASSTPENSPAGGKLRP